MPSLLITTPPDHPAARDLRAGASPRTCLLAVPSVCGVVGALSSALQPSRTLRAQRERRPPTTQVDARRHEKLRMGDDLGGSDDHNNPTAAYTGHHSGVYLPV